MSHYSQLHDVLAAVKSLAAQVQVGPNGEGEEWVHTLDAMEADLLDVIDDLEPDEAEQGLIPIPAGYAEA